ncbi:MAG: hypothetical protein AM1032_000163 [Mycoplasmataceae bacterium]|nr:MAG: hypothetical protein AM1032_000163 [Mycoplasmataceae bacterium]
MKKNNQQYELLIKRKNIDYNNLNSYFIDSSLSFLQTFYWFFSAFLIISIFLSLIFLGFSYYTERLKNLSFSVETFTSQISIILNFINNGIFSGNWKFFKGISLTFLSLLVIWRFFSFLIFNRQERILNEIIKIDSLFKKNPQDKFLKLSLIQSKIDLLKIRKTRDNFNYYFLIPAILINLIIFLLVHISNNKEKKQRGSSSHSNYRSNNYNYGYNPYYNPYPYFWSPFINNISRHDNFHDEIDSLDKDNLKKERDKIMLEIESENFYS